MQSKFKWLFLPPAIALVLFLGPLQSGAGAGTKPVTEAAAAQDTRSTSGNRNGTVGRPGTTPVQGSAIPEMPGGWQVMSTLVGVLLLGGVGLALFKRAKSATGPREGEFVSVRQSVRLSQRHTVHALEFDGAVLLVGECEGNLSVIQQGGAVPDRARDEAEIRSRYDEEDEGAVPRDMVIPRPDAATRRALPTAPDTDRATGQPAIRRAGVAPNGSAAAKLASFKNLLARAADHS